jgi:hypothetical protein
MSGVVPRYALDAPVTYTVKAGVTITGGQLVEATTGGVVQVGTAGSTKILGVATKDGIGTDGSVGTTSYSAYVVDISFPTNLIAVAHGSFVVAYAAAATFGAKLKAAATGGVTPWVSGTDAADLIVGYCAEPAGVGSAGNYLARIY